MLSYISQPVNKSVASRLCLSGHTSIPCAQESITPTVWEERLGAVSTTNRMSSTVTGPSSAAAATEEEEEGVDVVDVDTAIAAAIVDADALLARRWEAGDLLDGLCATDWNVLSSCTGAEEAAAAKACEDEDEDEEEEDREEREDVENCDPEKIGTCFTQQGCTRAYSNGCRYASPSAALRT